MANKKKHNKKVITQVGNKSASRNAIVNFCNDYLNVNAFKDFCHSGLQVEGAESVSHITLGTTISEALIKEAIRRRSQMIIVHHGIFSGDIGELPSLRGAIRGRLKLLLTHDINLVGYHLPLDAHPIVGNNAGLCKVLGVQKIKPVDVGYIGELAKAVSFKSFVSTVEKKLNTHAYTISAGPDKVKRIAVISGGSARCYTKTLDYRPDVFLIGEITEGTVRLLEEVRYNVIAAGHYNTEKLGVQNLGKLIGKKFGVKTEFVDIPCDI